MISRREILAGAVLGLSGLAGCVGQQPVPNQPDDDTASVDQDPRGVFERVAVEETTLVIEVAEEAEIDTVNVIAPSGELYRRLAVYRGVTRLSTEIDESYLPGVYELVAVRRSDNVASVGLEIAPSLVITDVALASEGHIQFPEGLGNTVDSQVAVAVSNEGSGPAFIRKLLVAGNVPNPTDELVEESVQRTGIFDTEMNQFRSEGITLLAGESTVLFSDTLPFFTGGSGRYCDRIEPSGEVEVRVVLKQTERSVSAGKRVKYLESEGGDDCEARADGGA